MQYFVIGANGEKYGPASVDDLNNWATEGRINAYSMVVAEDSPNSVPISSVPGFQNELLASSPTMSQPNYQNPPSYMSGGKIENHLVKSILTTFFCCMPLGIVAIVFAAQVDGFVRSGDFARAEDSARKANLFSNISLGIGLTGTVLYIILVIVMAATGNMR
jgi:hypothetical protein